MPRTSGRRRTFSGETRPSRASGGVPGEAEDLAPVGVQGLEQRRVVDAAVVQDLDGVAPALPAGEPVDGEDAEQRERDAELLLHLAGGAGRRVLVGLDDAAGEFEVLLVADLAEQDAAGGVPDDDVGDHALLRQRRVHQGGPAEHRIRARIVAAHAVDDDVAALAVDQRRAAQQTFAPETGPDRHSHRRVRAQGRRRSAAGSGRAHRTRTPTSSRTARCANSGPPSSAQTIRPAPGVVRRTSTVPSGVPFSTSKVTSC